jgi:hypothetical protein
MTVNGISINRIRRIAQTILRPNIANGNWKMVGFDESYFLRQRRIEFTIKRRSISVGKDE